MKNALRFSGWFLILLLAGCNGRISDPSVLVESTPTPKIVPLSPTATAVPAGDSHVDGAPVHSEPPLRFTFPMPGPMPQSLWRPPLYSIPWALGPFDHFYFARPIAADEVNWPLADYRYGGIFFSSDIVHTGVDIPAPSNTPVLAAGSGLIVWAGYGLYSGDSKPDDPYGLAITIRHDFGWNNQRLYTVYGHLDHIDVVPGQIVKTGEKIGEVGTTGKTTGPHLHFEVRVERNSYFATLNPELWLAPPTGWGVLVGQLRNTNGSLLTEQDVTVKDRHSAQSWTVRTYGTSAINSDPYYRENLVLSDLPAGEYTIVIDYLEERYTLNLTIHPGAITYFTFRGERRFQTNLPVPQTGDHLLPEFNP